MDEIVLQCPHYVNTIRDTTLAAVETGRNSVGNEIDPSYLAMAKGRLEGTLAVPRINGATDPQLLIDSSVEHSP